jgi:ketol-acid reductoisomerase
MLESILAKIGLPILISVISEALGRIDNPVTKGAAKALEEVDSAIKRGTITDSQVVEANRHVETLAQLRSEEIRANLSEVNQSLRAEIVSQDKYVRRMRPTSWPSHGRRKCSALHT